MRHRLGRAVALLAALSLVLPVPASGQDLESVRAERERIQERLDAAAERLAALEAAVAELTEETELLRGRADTLQAEVEAANDRIAARVRTLYMRSDANPMVALLGGTDPEDAVQRAAYIQRLVATDGQDAEAAAAARTELAALLDRLSQREADVEAALAEQQAVTEELEQDLADAAALEQRLEAEAQARREAEARRRAEEEERRRQAAEAAPAPAPAPAAPAGDGAAGGATPPPSGGAAVCPVDAPRSFTDTWGAPRSGGRRHQGTDILAPRGQTVRAIVSGVWDIRSYGRSAGHWGILRGDDGHHYYYMHLESHTVGDGARVAAGQQIATNGDTGNARGTTPHVHFEYHPGGGSPRNPYPLLRGVCG